MGAGQNGDLEKFFLIAWGMWYRRNQQIFKDKNLQPATTIEQALTIAVEYKEFRDVRQQRKIQICCWQPPSQDALKLNVDGVIFAEQDKARVGMLLRNETGGVSFCASKKENEVIDLMEVELLAILRGFQFCIPMGISKLSIEGDSLLLVQELNDVRKSRSTWGILVHEVHEMMKKFSKCSIHHNGRMSNVAISKIC